MTANWPDAEQNLVGAVSHEAMTPAKRQKHT
jgi:hypothetical protein